MIHLTLNTGRTADLPSPGDGSAVVGSLVPLVKAGGALPGLLSSFLVEVVHVEGGAAFSIRKADCPVLACGVAWTPGGAAAVWRMVEGHYLQLLDRVFDLVVASVTPAMPGVLPWLAAVLLPGAGGTSDDEVRHLADFEWYFAAAILEIHGGARNRPSE